MIASQTCDVLAQKREAEPFVEVLHCKPISKLRTQFKELRSTRTLDFKPNRETHESVVLSAHAMSDKYLIPRELLQQHRPDKTRRFSATAERRILAWYALRYGRPAWPDALVACIGKSKDALEAALEPLKDDIAQVRVRIAEKDQELVQSDNYHVAVFFVVVEDVWNSDVAGRKAIFGCHSKFVAELNKCHGVVVDEDCSGVFSGAEFTWQETQASDEWNFANLSHRDE